MFPEPPEDSDRTVFCQTCKAWRHPRHACGRDPAHETAPLPVMVLRRDGPASSDVVSRTSYESKRKHGIAKLELTAHSSGKNSVFGKTKPVYYLTDEHSAADVIETWLEINRGILADRELTTESITRALTKDRFQEAWQQLRAESEFDVLETPDRSGRGGGQQEDIVCPFCGNRVARLPTHLPCPTQSDS